MKAYAVYKDSGIEWVGKIPTEWEIQRLKHISGFGKGLNITKANLEENGVPVVSYGQIHSKINTGVHLDERLIRYVSPSYLEKGLNSLVGEGDVIFADTSEDYEGIGNSVFIDTKTQVFSGYHTIICRLSKSVISKYLAYLFQDDGWRKQVRSRVMGVKVFSLTQRILKNTTLLLPSLKEQSKIVTYLDRMTSQIDTTVADLEKQVELLEVYKRELIAQTVTKGLNKDVPMKDSGVEWIGDIPEHWKLLRLKHISRFGKGLNITKANLKEEGIAVVSYGQIHSKINTGVHLDEKLIRYVSPSYLEKGLNSLVGEGDVIFADTSEDYEGIGNSVLIDTNAQVFSGYHTIICRLSPSIISKYLAYLFQDDGWRKQVRSRVMGVKVFSLTQRILKNTTVLLPSKEEQSQIVVYLDRKTTQIDEAMVNMKTQIEKLKEYRKIIIHDAVTGKINVSEEEKYGN